MYFSSIIGVIRIVTIEILPTERRGTGSGVKSLVSAIGITMGLLIGSVVISISADTLELAFIVLSVPCLINVPLVIKYIQETKDVHLAKIKD